MKLKNKPQLGLRFCDFDKTEVEMYRAELVIRQPTIIATAIVGVKRELVPQNSDPKRSWEIVLYFNNRKHRMVFEMNLAEKGRYLQTVSPYHRANNTPTLEENPNGIPTLV